MLPAQYYSIIRCPRCGGQFDQPQESRLHCGVCNVDYPVVDNIPILLVEEEMDAVAQEIKAWYEKNWQGQIGNTTAKKLHEDTSGLGQRYIVAGEQQYIYEMSARSGTFFLDVGCGAQPRVAAGEGHRYHVCLDLSLAGLQQCRQLLGTRGLFVVGSATNPPLANGFAATVLAAHCIYHIKRELQPGALRRLYSLAAGSGVINIFYFNPSSFEIVVTWPIRALKRLLARGAKKESFIYFHPLSIGRMTEIINQDVGAHEWSVRPLRFFSINVSRPVFSLPVLGRASYYLFRSMKRFPVILNSYVVYTILKAT
jgi:uncharacterized protein YbaR (Trm112 family)